jgi:hypothetical protein
MADVHASNEALVARIHEDHPDLTREEVVEIAREFGWDLDLPIPCPRAIASA